MTLSDHNRVNVNPLQPEDGLLCDHAASLARVASSAYANSEIAERRDAGATDRTLHPL